MVNLLPPMSSTRDYAIIVSNTCNRMLQTTAVTAAATAAAAAQSNALPLPLHSSNLSSLLPFAVYLVLLPPLSGAYCCCSTAVSW